MFFHPTYLTNALGMPRCDQRSTAIFTESFSSTTRQTRGFDPSSLGAKSFSKHMGTF